jgi:hypothetical protein
MDQGGTVTIDERFVLHRHSRFAPPLPDPRSRYKWKLVGGDWLGGLYLGCTPFGMPERPGCGRGRARISIANLISSSLGRRWV